MEKKYKTVKTPWLSGTEEIAKYLRCGLTKTTALIQKGKLPGLRKIGGAWVIRCCDLDAFILYGKPYRKLTHVQRIDVMDGG